MRVKLKFCIGGKGKSENERGDLEECPIGNGQNWKEQLYVIVGTGFL